MFRRIFDFLSGGRQRKVLTMIPTWSTGLEVFERSRSIYYAPLIYGIVRKIANTSSVVSIKVVDGNGDAMIDHPLKRLLQRPNPYLSEYGFWYSVIAGLLIDGVVYYEKQRNAGGMVIALWPLPANRVRPIVNKTSVEAYEVYDDNGTRQVLPAQDVLRFKTYDPRGLLAQASPCDVALSLIETDSALTEIIKTFLREGASPLGVLKTKARITDDDVERIQARWRQRYGGAAGWVVPAVLDVDADYQKIGSSLNELEVSHLDARVESRICMIFDIPPILAGVKVGLDRSTFSNYAEARRSWWEDSIIPRYEDLLDEMQNDLGAEFGVDGKNAVVAFDYSRTPVAVSREAERMAQLVEAYKNGAVTKNELRDALGLPRIESGDVTIQPATQVAQEVKADNPRAKWESDKEAPDWLMEALEDEFVRLFEAQKKEYLKRIKDMGIA
jgi:HK97 family phage portal protein